MVKYKIRMKDLYPGMPLRARRPYSWSSEYLVRGKVYAVQQRDRAWFVVGKKKLNFHLNHYNLDEHFERAEGPW